ncbi:hypothetical protein BYT27DRAFT_7208842 [Phlegmacium glaucopus]|nr:hypothetical protein BYT27DRAFT_7208842 [Phlegmacium glaucopus]
MFRGISPKAVSGGRGIQVEEEAPTLKGLDTTDNCLGLGTGLGVPGEGVRLAGLRSAGVVASSESTWTRTVRADNNRRCWRRPVDGAALGLCDGVGREGWEGWREGHWVGAGGIGGGALSFDTMSARQPTEELFCVAISLRSRVVLACWVELASKKVRAAERSVFTVEATAEAIREEDLSMMLSSRTKAAARAALMASGGILGRRDIDPTFGLEPFVGIDSTLLRTYWGPAGCWCAGRILGCKPEKRGVRVGEILERRNSLVATLPRTPEGMVETILVVQCIGKLRLDAVRPEKTTKKRVPSTSG